MKKIGFLSFVGLAAMVVSCGGKTMTKDDAIKILEGNTVEKAEEALGETATVKIVDKIEKVSGAFAEGGVFASATANYSNREAETEIATANMFFTVEMLENYYSSQVPDLKTSLEAYGKNGIKFVASQSRSQSQGGITMKMEQELVDIINDYGCIESEVNRVEMSCSGQVSGEFVWTETVTVTYSK